jgi:hypothetical protein
MSLNEQYILVFGPQDPSRRKLEDLPYFIKLKSRQKDGRCVYCHREQCSGCPLPFDDKKTLREYLEQVGVTTKPDFYRQEQRITISKAKSSKQK